LEVPSAHGIRQARDREVELGIRQWIGVAESEREFGSITRERTEGLEPLDGLIIERGEIDIIPAIERA
jgi:hypothetical protein